MRFECCISDLNSLDKAIEFGVDHVEICNAIELGGITPNPGALEIIRDRFKGQLSVLIRPRAGDFVYSNAEKKQILRELKWINSFKPDYLVFGALLEDFVIDTAFMRTFVDHASGLPVCFHRAFDLVGDQKTGLEHLQKLGIDRLLTSGGNGKAVQNLEKLKWVFENKGADLDLVAAGGIRSDDMMEIYRKTGIQNFHGALISEHSEPGSNAFGKRAILDHMELEKVLQYISVYQKASNTAAIP